MTRKTVFISYRRDDAAGFPHAVHDRLVEFLPEERVFMDVHGIETGADFSKRLVAFGVMTVGASDVDFVMVIVFGAIPAALMFLAAFAMQRRGKSSAPAAVGRAH